MDFKMTRDAQRRPVEISRRKRWIIPDVMEFILHSACHDNVGGAEILEWTLCNTACNSRAVKFYPSRLGTRVRDGLCKLQMKLEFSCKLH
jgi:hypothetical protein